MASDSMNCISSLGLRKLAEHAKNLGATRYAEAYLLLARRLDEIGPKLNKCVPEDLYDEAMSHER